MPPKGWKKRTTEGSLKAACEWKRLFFSERVFTSVEALLQAAVMGGSAKPYVEGLLQLGHRRRRRKTLTDVAVAMGAAVKPNWLTSVLSSVWLVYSAELSLWKEQHMEESAELGTVTKKQRKVLRGTGWLTVKRPQLKLVAEKRREDVRAGCGGRVFLCWVDNFNKFRYSRNPNEDRDRCINATVMALLPSADVNRAHWEAWPTVLELHGQVEQCGRQMKQHHKLFTDRVRVLLNKGLRFEHVRVPCDLRRFGVTTMPWTPYTLVGADIKSTAGLVEAVHEVLKLQRFLPV